MPLVDYNPTSMSDTDRDIATDGPRRFRLISCRVLQREAYFCASRSSNIVDVDLVEQGLHNEPNKLTTELQRSIDETDPDTYEAVLLGYGLCSNGIAGLTAPVTMAVPRGHDCMTLLLGSKERYRDYFDKHRGIYWYSPGWIEYANQPGKRRFDVLRESYVEKYGDENADYLMEMEQNWMTEYSRATFIQWPFPESDRYRSFTKKCAEFMDWEYDEVPGDPGLFQRLMDGVWNDSETLIVEPGQQIVSDPASPGIIRAVDLSAKIHGIEGN